ncbi:glutathione S-transferase alpha-3-like [Cricetulus griseus]|uniref:glutathione S-transferase alpha-3-like n=1 Tax=Cricetulus griseus TaxID=10029 RepID=UPI0007DA94FB|nr:glutathione S-transferase alpha-3-like [Cricetulus griseus]
MYTEGTVDLNEMLIRYPFLPLGEKDANLAQITQKARKCYFPAFEEVLKSHGQDYLVGNRLSRADIHMVELLYHIEELNDSIVAIFPLLQALRTRVSNLPTVKKFLQPGSQRKPLEDEKFVEELKKSFF